MVIRKHCETRLPQQHSAASPPTTPDIATDTHQLVVRSRLPVSATFSPARELGIADQFLLWLFWLTLELLVKPWVLETGERLYVYSREPSGWAVKMCKEADLDFLMLCFMPWDICICRQKPTWKLPSTPKHFQKVLKTYVLVANYIFYFLKKPKAEFLIHVTESSLDFGPVGKY